MALYLPSLPSPPPFPSPPALGARSNRPSFIPTHGLRLVGEDDDLGSMVDDELIPGLAEKKGHGSTRATNSFSTRELEKSIAKGRFCVLFALRREAFDHLFDVVVSSTDSDALLDAAIEEFEERGNQDRLELAARLLAAKGREALPTLQRIAATPFRCQSAFVDLVLQNDKLSLAEKKAMAMQFAQSKELDTRWRVLAVASELPVDLRIPLLGLLSRDENAELRDEAKQQIQELER